MKSWPNPWQMKYVEVRLTSYRWFDLLFLTPDIYLDPVAAKVRGVEELLNRVCDVQWGWGEVVETSWTDQLISLVRVGRHGAKVLAASFCSWLL